MNRNEQRMNNVKKGGGALFPLPHGYFDCPGLVGVFLVWTTYCMYTKSQSEMRSNCLKLSCWLKSREGLGSLGSCTRSNALCNVKM